MWRQFKRTVAAELFYWAVRIDIDYVRGVVEKSAWGRGRRA